MKIQTYVSTLAAAALLLFASHLGATDKPNPDQVKIDNFSFTPPTLTVHAGTKVTWINKDDVPHTVTSVEKKFKSRALDTDERYSFTFSAPGTYKYFCSVHPHMTGTIIVEN